MSGDTPANVAKFDPNAFGGLASLNVTGQGTEDLKKVYDAMQNYQDQLEHRYDKPNWFNVAAGFLKPQLGGFGASLGSASQALGENVENKRAAQMQSAQIGIGKEILQNNLNKRFKQNEIFQKSKASGKPPTLEDWKDVMALDSSSDIAKAFDQYYQQAKGQMAAAGTAAELAKNYPALQKTMSAQAQRFAAPDGDTKDWEKNQSDYQNNLRTAAMSLPGMTEAKLNSMPISKLEDLMSQHQKSIDEVGLSNEDKARQRHDDSMLKLSSLEHIRDLALGKGVEDIKDANGNVLTGKDQMQKALGIFQGNGLINAIGKTIDEGKVNDLLKGWSEKLAGMNMSDSARAKFQELIKELYKNAAMMRNSSSNPTDAYGEMVRAGSPSLGNSQDALVGILDSMAHAEHKNINEYRYMKDKGLNFQSPYDSEGNYSKFQQNYADAHRKQNVLTPTVDTPYFYNPGHKTDYSKENAELDRRISGGTPAKTEAQPTQPAAAKPTTRAEAIKGMNGNWWVKKGTQWVDSGSKEKPQ